MNSSEGNDTKALIERWRKGDESAAEDVFGLYWERLWLLAKSRIDGALARRVGASDAVQSAFESFFRRTREGQYYIDQSDSLWGLLATITLNKVRDHSERHNAAKRDAGRETRVYEIDPTAFARVPTVQEAVALADELEYLVRSVSHSEAEMLGFCLQGFSPSEIAQKCSCSRWTVRRVLKRMGTTLRNRLNEIV